MNSAARHGLSLLRISAPIETAPRHTLPRSSQRIEIELFQSVSKRVNITPRRKSASARVIAPSAVKVHRLEALRHSACCAGQAQASKVNAAAST